MKCLVCDTMIRIDSLRALFAVRPLQLCHRCEGQLVRSRQDGVLFEDNEWLRAIIDRLGQGDLVLVDLFKRSLYQELQRQKWVGYRVEVMAADGEMPYPWMEILVNGCKKDGERENQGTLVDVLVVRVDKKEECFGNEIAILG